MLTGKSYNNTQYFNRYYYNQTIKNHIKAIFRDYFAKPLNATFPVKQFREWDRDTEEFESLARKDRRKRNVEENNDSLEDLNSADSVMDGKHENHLAANKKQGHRKKRRVIDRACFYDKQKMGKNIFILNRKYFLWISAEPFLCMTNKKSIILYLTTKE